MDSKAAFAVLCLACMCVRVHVRARARACVCAPAGYAHARYCQYAYMPMHTHVQLKGRKVYKAEAVQPKVETLACDVSGTYVHPVHSTSPAKQCNSNAYVHLGSSGGTAALIAARVAPSGFCSDTGGSCRVPGAMCGIAGQLELNFTLISIVHKHVVCRVTLSEPCI